MTKQYDLVIVGTGAAATTAALRVRAADGKLRSPIFDPLEVPVRYGAVIPKK